MLQKCIIRWWCIISRWMTVPGVTQRFADDCLRMHFFRCLTLSFFMATSEHWP